MLDIGGQDTKAIQVDEHGIVESFHMNDRCAAGTRRYLGCVADGDVKIDIHPDSIYTGALGAAAFAQRAVA